MNYVTLNRSVTVLFFPVEQDSKKTLIEKKQSSNLVVQMQATNTGSQIYI